MYNKGDLKMAQNQWYRIVPIRNSTYSKIIDEMGHMVAGPYSSHAKAQLSLLKVMYDETPEEPDVDIDDE